MRSNPSQNIEMIALRRFKLKRSLRPMRSARLPGIVWLPWVCVVPPLSAQDLAPGTGQMIEQLKLQRHTKPHQPQVTSPAQPQHHHRH